MLTISTTIGVLLVKANNTLKQAKKTKAAAKDVDGASDGGRPDGMRMEASRVENAPVISPEDALKWLCAAYHRKDASFVTRTGIVEAYAAYFKCQGPAWVESYYTTIVKHLLQEFLGHMGAPVAHEKASMASGSSQPASHTTAQTASRKQTPAKILANDYANQTLRAHIDYLLNATINRRLLTETAQFSCASFLVDHFASKWPARTPTDVVPAPTSLICALNELSALLLSLRDSARALQVSQ